MAKTKVSKKRVLAKSHAHKSVTSKSAQKKAVEALKKATERHLKEKAKPQKSHPVAKKQVADTVKLIPVASRTLPSASTPKMKEPEVLAGPEGEQEVAEPAEAEGEASSTKDAAVEESAEDSNEEQESEDEAQDEDDSSSVQVSSSKKNDSFGRSFEIGAAIEFGWKAVKENVWFFVGLFFLIAILNIMAMRVSGIGSKIVLGILVLGINLGYVKMALDVVEGKKPEFKELFSCFGLLPWYIIGSISYLLVVSAGLFLLIVPGILWLLTFGFFMFVIVDERANPLQALRKSAAITSGVKPHLFVFLLVLLGICILGLIPFGIGLILTIPLCIIASAHVYDQLKRLA